MVDDNHTSYYSQHDYSQAVLGRKIQKIIGHPSTHTFIKIVENNLFPNCPITCDDIIAAERIFGPDVGSLKGKTVHRSSVPVRTSSSNILSGVIDKYRKVTLAGDIMFVNSMPFLVTMISRHIKFSTYELLENQQLPTIIKAMIDNVRKLYKKRGFHTKTIIMDGQFDGLRANLAEMGMTLNSSKNDEHVPEVEHHICTLKERVRSVYNMLPFAKMLARMIIELVFYCGFWLNS